MSPGRAAPARPAPSGATGRARAAAGCAWGPAGSARARRGACRGRGRLRGSSRMLALVAMTFIGIDYALHQRVAHDILGLEDGKGDASYVGENPSRLDQAAFRTARKIDLGYVAGHHRLAAEADAGEEHFHLLGRGVLSLVQNDERVVESAAAHVGERCEFDGNPLQHPLYLVESNQVVQGVVERAQGRG